MGKIFIPFLVFFLFLENCFLEAWMDPGHMAVTKIAYERLEPAVKAKADTLIAKWEKAFPESSTFVTAGCWADDIARSGLDLFGTWHHSSIPYDPHSILSSEQKAALISSLKGKDIIFAIEKGIKTLENPRSHPWSQAMMLRFLLHFVADIHQPLHCTNFYNSTFPTGDKGGNLFKIQWPGQEKGNLHAFWDSLCGMTSETIARPLSIQDEKNLSDLVDHITTTFPESFFSEDMLNTIDVEKWREESAEFAPLAYEGIFPMGTLPPDYIERGQYIAQQRIALAGYRLSRLLNKTLKSS